MPGATFVGLALVVRAAHAGMTVLGGTYSGSHSSSESMTSRADGATDLEHPREYTRSGIGTMSVSNCI